MKNILLPRYLHARYLALADILLGTALLPVLPLRMKTHNRQLYHPLRSGYYWHADQGETDTIFPVRSFVIW